MVYHLPLTLWAIPALLRNDPRVPLALLVFGLETSLTTLVCLAEMLSWEELSAAQRGLGGLGGMYGGYLATGKCELCLNGPCVGYCCCLASAILNLCILRAAWLIVIVGIFMTLDCYARLDQLISKHKGLEPVTKKKL